MKLAGHTASEGNFRFLWDLKVHYRVRKIPPLDPILSHLNTVHIITPHLFTIHSNITLLSDLPADFLTEILYAFLISRTHAACFSQLNVIYLITLNLPDAAILSVCVLHMSVS
jgi:hypothetical protein